MSNERNEGVESGGGISDIISKAVRGTITANVARALKRPFGCGDPTGETARMHPVGKPLKGFQAGFSELDRMAEDGNGQTTQPVERIQDKGTENL